MKKIMVLLICILTLSGCARTGEKANQPYFTAKVAAVYETSLLIEVTEPGSSGISAGSPAYIGRDASTESLSAGDIIEIKFNGNVMESYPLQLGEIYSVEKIRSAVIPDWGIELDTENVTASGLTVVCSHSGETSASDLGTSPYYVIEQHKNGSWIRVNYKELSEWEVGWDDVLYTIPSNGTARWDTDWKWLYGELSPGEYRIGKEILKFADSGEFERAVFYAEFEI